jgi:hypothetical protein
MSRQRKSLLESVPVLLLIGVLAGAIGGFGVGAITLLKSASAASSAAK